MDQVNQSRKKEIAAALGVLAVVIVLVLAISLTSKKKANTSLANSNPTSTSTATSSSGSTTSRSAYKDGSYTATGIYESPGGNEDITVNVTLKSGIVTATSAKSGANDSEAEQYQSQFISGYKQMVVGKTISSINLNRVSGSSLTSQGFNEAINQIKQQAQA